MPDGRRSAPRLAANIKVYYRVPGQPEKDCHSLDLSMRGIFLQVTGRFEVHDWLEINFMTSVKSERKPVACVCQVARILSREEAQTYGLIPGIAVEYRKFYQGLSDLRAFLMQRLALAPEDLGEPNLRPIPDGALTAKPARSSSAPVASEPPAVDSSRDSNSASAASDRAFHPAAAVGFVPLAPSTPLASVSGPETAASLRAPSSSGVFSPVPSTSVSIPAGVGPSPAVGTPSKKTAEPVSLTERPVAEFEPEVRYPEPSRQAEVVPTPAPAASIQPAMVPEPKASNAVESSDTWTREAWEEYFATMRKEAREQRESLSAIPDARRALRLVLLTTIATLGFFLLVYGAMRFL